MAKRSFFKKGDRKQGARGRRITVKESATLLPFLFDLLKEQSKNSVKALLAHGQISVNGKVSTQFDTPLKPNDVVGISYERGKVAFSHALLKILWEDDDLIIVNKREGLLSVANVKAKSREHTAYSLLSDYVKKADPRNKVFVLQRLARDISGLMLFAKNKGVQESLHNNWGRIVQDNIFVAVVEGRPEKDTGLISPNAFTEEGARQFIVKESGKGETITRYKVLRSNGDYSLLEIRLEIGRRNLIQEQMEELGCPVVRDLNNGTQVNPEGRLMLQAHKLRFQHPVTGDELSFETHIPTAFISITK